MISSERTQNIIIASTIIIAVISSVTLVSNGIYYGGTYALLGNLDITFENLTISNIDPLNSSKYPIVVFTFNLATHSPYDGNVRINFMGLSTTLNGDRLSYMAFSLIPPVADQHLTPTYNHNFVFNDTADDELGIDRQTILDAYNSSTWFWEVEFRYSYYFFDVFSTIDFSYRYFNITEVTIV